MTRRAKARAAKNQPKQKDPTGRVETDSRPDKDGGSRIEPPQQSVQPGVSPIRTPRIYWRLPSQCTLRRDPVRAFRRLHMGSTGKEHNMDCVNHSGVTATAYCQSCGKALCANCVRNAAGGQIFCEPCKIAWQSLSTAFCPAPSGCTQPLGRRGAGPDSGRGRNVQRPVLQGPHPRSIFAVLVSITTTRGSSASSSRRGSSTSRLRRTTRQEPCATDSQCPIRWG